MRRVFTLCASLLLLVALGCTSQQPASTSSGDKPIGQTMPDLLVQGWVNGSPVSTQSLAGKVVVLDCFATW